MCHYIGFRGSSHIWKMILGFTLCARYNDKMMLYSTHNLSTSINIPHHFKSIGDQIFMFSKPFRFLKCTKIIVAGLMS